MYFICGVSRYHDTKTLVLDRKAYFNIADLHLEKSVKIIQIFMYMK